MAARDIVVIVRFPTTGAEERITVKNPNTTLVSDVCKQAVEKFGLDARQGRFGLKFGTMMLDSTSSWRFSNVPSSNAQVVTLVDLKPVSSLPTTTATMTTIQPPVHHRAAAPVVTVTPDQPVSFQTCLAKLRSELWDDDARVAVLTLMRICTNIAANPNEVKFRKLRPRNGAFAEKLKNSQGALEFLAMLGFSLSNNEDQQESVLVMDANFSESTLEQGYWALNTACDELGDIESSKRPLFKMMPRIIPPPPLTTTATAATAAPSMPTTTTFDPFKTHVIGHTAPKMEISGTERKVQELKDKMAAMITASKNQINTIDRCVVAIRPDHPEFNPRHFAVEHSSDGDDDDQQQPSKEDLQLLARQQAVWQEKQKKAENFQTRAMRELDELARMRIFNTTLLRIQLPDKTIVQALFSPYETIEDVCMVMGNCMVPPVTAREIRLVTVPPTANMHAHSVLADLGLIPAAILMVSLIGGGTIHVDERLFTRDLNKIQVCVPRGVKLVPDIVGGGTAAAGTSSKTTSGMAKPKWLKM